MKKVALSLALLIPYSVLRAGLIQKIAVGGVIVLGAASAPHITHAVKEEILYQEIVAENSHDAKTDQDVKERFLKLRSTLKDSTHSDKVREKADTVLFRYL